MGRGVHTRRYPQQGKPIEPISFGRGFLQEVLNNKDSGPREMHKAVCADCGKETDVPFKPSKDRPVYCRECYAKRRPRQ
ncbi:hypothetical protein KY359_06650 [Candidatus Woesearchaeota archaeon]|nr:hypothetical protein [Candidatus Woesearchaeota archaeon]